MSGLFKPVTVNEAGKWAGQLLPMESPIVPRASHATSFADLKTPGFMVQQRPFETNGPLEDSFGAPIPNAAPTLTIPKTPKFATASRSAAVTQHIETTEERELREIREAKEKKRLEKLAREERMQKALRGESNHGAGVVAQQAPLTMPVSPKFATSARVGRRSTSEHVAPAVVETVEQVEEPVAEEQPVQQEEEEEEESKRNGMFFEVKVSNRPVVERKFKLASDRRAAARKRKDQTVDAPKTEFVPFAEALFKVQQQALKEEQQEEEDGDQQQEEDAPAPAVINIAPFRPTIPETPKFATTQRARVRDHVVAAPVVVAKPIVIAPTHVAPIQRPEVTVAKSPKFSKRFNKGSARAGDVSEDDDMLALPTKRYRSNAAHKAAADGGALGVPMIPKMALTRPEEFDFATAARALAMEGGATKEHDIFEEAAAEVRTTSNKIGMYVDLDTNLDQETAVAKGATTGKKRNPGMSRLPGLEDGDVLVQPDFGDESLFQPSPPKKTKEETIHHHAAPIAPPALTIPKTPKFATTARARAAHKSPARRKSLEKLKQMKPVYEHQPVSKPIQPPALTIPETPKFATTARAREAFKPIQESKKQVAPVVEKRQEKAAAPVQHFELTEPKPFSFATDARIKNSVRSVAASVSSHQPSKPSHKVAQDTYSSALGLTEPKPFSFATNTRLGDATRKQRVENEHPNDHIHNQKPSNTAFGGLTEPKPFNLRVETRGAVAKEVLQKKIQEEEEERQRRANFKAKPFVETQPYIAPRPAPQVTEVQDFVLNSDVRAARRNEFEDQMRQKRDEEARIAAEREYERQLREEQDLRELRKRLVHKARPVLREDPFPVKQTKHSIALTVPESPKFATSKRFNRVM